MHEREIQRWCRQRMDILDSLPAIVRNAVREANAYTEPAWARELVKRHGPERAAQIILNQSEG
jgi:hypothetical protein